MRLRLFHVDAFADRPFAGNPAAVVPLASWLDDALMQSIAAENNLSETAFFVPEGDAFHLRWFTPTTEVPLCGHATLAAGFVLLRKLPAGSGEGAEGSDGGQTVRFRTLSGHLTVSDDRREDRLRLDLPRRVPEPCEPPPELAQGLGASPIEVHATAGDTNYYAVFRTESEIAALRPRMDLLVRLHPHGVCVTAPGNEAHFVSRYFAPSYGVPEDPVTGSTHCALVPYWAARLGNSRLRARQISARGGELQCEDRANRVTLAGGARLYLEGNIEV